VVGVPSLVKVAEEVLRERSLTKEAETTKF
jgi:hypothetical protein